MSTPWSTCRHDAHSPSRTRCDPAQARALSPRLERRNHHDRVRRSRCRSGDCIPTCGADPTHVAKAYIEARFARDWAKAWELVCGHSRAAIGSYTTYAANADYWADNYCPPSDVDVSVGHLRGAQRSGGPSAAVTLSVTTDQGNREIWEVGGELSIVEEDGEFRVCDKGSNVG